MNEFDHGNLQIPYLSILNEPQREAVLRTEGPLLVLAGAGSGKTRMLVSRMSYLVDQKRVNPWQILAVTFTNKAAQEMRERVAKAIPQHAQPEIGTFHSICVRILRREGAKLPFTKPFVIYDDTDQLSLLKSIVKRLGLDEKAAAPKAFQYAIDRAKNDALSPEELPDDHGFSPVQKNLKRVYQIYQDELALNNACDFGDLIVMVYRLLRDHPEVRARYQRRYQYVMVDEYQDTNRAQYLLLSLLCSRLHGGNENLCVVGDEDQSIYKWRGADIRNILDFEADFAGAHTVKLEQNYRSTKNIIEAASAVIQNNSIRKDKKLWTENEAGDHVRYIQLQDERQEAEYVISEMRRFVEQDHLSLEDLVIFYRTHAQSRQFEDVLRRHKIAYQIVGGLRFFDRKEIKDILSFFKLIVNPADSVSLKRVINVPARGIGKTSIDKLEKYWKDRQALEPSFTLFDSLEHIGNKKITDFKKMVQGWIDFMPGKTLSEVYHRVLDDTRYVPILKEEGTEEALTRIENLEEFDTLIQEFQEDLSEEITPIDPDPDLAGDAQEPPSPIMIFLERTSLVSEPDDGNASKSSVKLMTLHSSKGLEFPIVFMVGMEEGLFPSIRPGEEEDEEEIEEERRLCYVGMTRARERLTLSSVSIRRLWGNVLYQYPARFIAEIPQEFIEVVNLTGYNSTQTRNSVHRGASSDATDFDFSDEDESQEENPTFVGRKIRHPEYGMGSVLAVEGQGTDIKITIEFVGRVQKKFYLRFVESFLE